MWPSWRIKLADLAGSVSWRLTPAKRHQLPWPKGRFKLPERRWRSHVKHQQRLDCSHTHGARRAYAACHPGIFVTADHHQKCHPKKGSVWSAKLWSAKLPASLLQPSVRRRGCDEKSANAETVVVTRAPLHNSHLPIRNSSVSLLVHTLTTPPNALLSYGATSTYPQYGTADVLVLTLQQHGPDFWRVRRSVFRLCIH